MESVVGPRLQGAECLLLDWQRSLGGALKRFELGVRKQDRLFIAQAHLDPRAFKPEDEALLAFWANAYGAALVNVSELDLHERGNFLARFEACEHRVEGVGAAELKPALERLLKSLGVTRTWKADGLRLPLALSHAGPVTWEPATKHLEVRAEVLPPLGAKVPVALSIPGVPDPFVFEAQVAAVRGAATANVAKGYALSVKGLSMEYQAVLEGFHATRGDEAAPSTPSTLARRVALRCATPGEFLDTYERYLSKHAALVPAQAVPEDVEGDVVVDLTLPDGAVVSLPARVVVRTGAGVGLELVLGADEWNRLWLEAAKARSGPASGPTPPPVRAKVETKAELSAAAPAVSSGSVFVKGEKQPLGATVATEVELPGGQVVRGEGTVVGVEDEGISVQVSLPASGLSGILDNLFPSAPPLAKSVVAAVQDLLAQAPSASPRTPRLGNYELVSRLGRGGMAEVYFARAVAGPHQGRAVAIKRLAPELAHEQAVFELFASEADLTRQLSHPNIVRLLDVGVEGDEYFLVMELVDGRDLGQVLRKCERQGITLPVDFAVYLAKTLLDALDSAHNATGPRGTKLGIVHCDVSPSNLFVSRAGDVKLGDFGVASVRGDTEASKQLGKPHYLSPEALEGEVSPGRDLWAAGVTLYELLTLHRPFDGETPEEVFAAIRKGKYAPVTQRRPEVSSALALVVARALAPKKEDRFETAEEFSRALAPCFDAQVGTPLAIAAMVRGLFTETVKA